VPASLVAQLHELRRRVWTIKSIEAASGALFGVLVAYLAVFALDRWFDTPGELRVPILLVAVAGCAVLPWYFHRWIWSQRRLDQLARLVRRKHPSMGDQMLGTIELVANPAEQSRSRALCEAAIRQVADEASRRDFRDAVPAPRHRLAIGLAAVPALVALGLLAFVPAAALNAWARFATPWLPVERYTFTSLEPLADRLVVAHGEPVPMAIRLRQDSAWQPAKATGQLGSQPLLSAELKDNCYAFMIPPQVEAQRLRLRIGDARYDILIEPKLRPELSALVADVELPAYLQRWAGLRKDVRGGAVTVVNGSSLTFRLTANRNLVQATLDDRPAQTAGPTLTTDPLKIDSPRKLVFRWRDEFGLEGLDPFTVTINARDDEAPSISCEDLPRNKVVLDTETLHFKARALDDFGVKAIGLEWHGKHGDGNITPARGERLLAAGASDKETLEHAGTFNAKALDIAPQELAVRLYVEDFLPGRERVFSQVYTLYVLSAEQHFVWLTDQLNKWHRQSLEVRDREMQLHHANQQLRLLPPEELDHPETRRKIEAQSAAERANGRRLTGLVTGGEELVRQAMRNPEFGVGHLEKWGEMLQILKDISANRMPNVADLLKQSAEARGAVAGGEPKKSGPTAGQQRPTPGGAPQPKPGESQPRPPVPQVADAESSQQPAPKAGKEQKPNESKSSPKLGLPVTTVTGGKSKPQPEGRQQPPAGQKLDEAVAAQHDLLAEFDKIADELNKVLANLEGSTLLKRLKAESRRQNTIAGNLGSLVSSQFGQPTGARAASKPTTRPADDNAKPSEPSSASARPDVAQLTQAESDSSKNLSNIMDDMQAYFERRRYQRFKSVLDEMRKEDVIGSLRQLGDDLRKETGLSLAQAEFWSDTLDRWADDLVDPSGSGKCPGCKSKASLPPSVVLEAMQILEGEVNLREETRGTEQARPALKKEEYAARSDKLRKAQDSLAERVGKLTVRIAELPDGEQEFGKEIKLLSRVENVMDEAAGILGRADTGREAIAAETEAIELLLQSKRINPKGGGGGGASPGGGGGGTTNDSALALIGLGVNEHEVREDQGTGQTTGRSGSELPEEFRAGLDEYFSRLERDGAKP